MVQPFIPITINIVLRAEGPLVQGVLCPLTDKRPLVARKGRTILVTFKEVLADFRADPFQQKTQMPGDGIAAQNRVMRLDQVMHADARQKQEGQRQERAEQASDRKGKAQGTKAQDTCKGQGQRDMAQVKGQGQKRHGMHSPKRQASGYQALTRLWRQKPVRTSFLT